MKLEEVAHALRTAAEVARAGEHLFESLARTRHARVWPALALVGLGVGVGALVFDDRARDRVKTWLYGRAPIGVEPKSAPPPVETRPS